jgi:hypothetical protein
VHEPLAVMWIASPIALHAPAAPKATDRPDDAAA